MLLVNYICIPWGNICSNILTIFFVWIACLTMNWFFKNLCSVLYVLVRRKIYNYFLPVCGLPFTASFKKYLLVDLIYLKCRERIRSLTCWFSPQIPLKVKVGLDWGQEPGTQSGECATFPGVYSDGKHSNWDSHWLFHVRCRFTSGSLTYCTTMLSPNLGLKLQMLFYFLGFLTHKTGSILESINYPFVKFSW